MFATVENKQMHQKTVSKKSIFQVFTKIEEKSGSKEKRDAENGNRSSMVEKADKPENLIINLKA
jgi:hypothetical protein